MDLVILLAIIRRRRRTHRYWVHPLNQRRLEWGEHLKILEMYRLYPDRFRQYTRLSPSQFEFLLLKMKSTLTKKNTNYREAIPPDLRLFVTLRYLATGDNLITISTSYSIGHTTVWRIVRSTTKIIWKHLTEFFKAPTDSVGWKKIADDFYGKWNFPNCVGSIDGKHVDIEAPYKSGSHYFNYKGRFSIILLATCDAEYRFTTIDVGAYGKQSDAGVFSASELGNRLENGVLNLPEMQTLPGSNKTLPCTFVGDEAFPLRCYMMRPFPGRNLNPTRRIFNYRLSRARRVIENAFGIMSKRFRIFRRPIVAQPCHVENIIMACVALHNFLRTDDISAPSSASYCPAGYADIDDEENGLWRQEEPSLALRNLTQLSSNAHAAAAKEMRETFANYFMNEGSVSWQMRIVGLEE